MREKFYLGREEDRLHGTHIDSKGKDHTAMIASTLGSSMVMAREDSWDGGPGSCQSSADRPRR